AGIVDSMVQLVAAAAGGALLGISTGAIMLRTKALTLLMLTLAITSVLLEIANKATALTGGADGLSGVVVAPILGLFRFDIFGKTAYLYCLLVLFLGWWLVRRLIYSPFGTSLTGVRENSLRMHAIGAPVYWRLVLVYTLSATIAGVAGGLITQTNQFVGLNVLSFEPAEQAVSGAALETRGLCKSFGALTVAADIDFRLERGARHALIGPNGAGKTTFVNMLTGLLSPSSGRIVLGGEDITSTGQAKR